MIPPLQYTHEDVIETAKTCWGEARNQGDAGIAAVAWTVRNRAEWDEELDPGHPEHEWWGTTPAKAATHPWQYSCRNPNDPNAAKIAAIDVINDPLFLHIQQTVVNVFSGFIPDPTHGCTTYKVRGTEASWDKAVDGVPPVMVGSHDFWRLSPDGHVLPLLQDGVSNDPSE